MKTRRLLWIAILCGMLVCAPLSVNAKRMALVIGNAAYKDMPLTNPVNDAQDIAKALDALGFSVTLKTDITHREMVNAIQDFGQQITSGDVTLFYFSGHGVQSNNLNYLLPLETHIRSEADIAFEGQCSIANFCDRAGHGDGEVF